MEKPITGHDPDLIKAMSDAGIIPDLCKRVVIDITADDCVTLYYETFSDKRIIEIDLPKRLANSLGVRYKPQ